MDGGMLRAWNLQRCEMIVTGGDCLVKGVGCDRVCSVYRSGLGTRGNLALTVKLCKQETHVMAIELFRVRLMMNWCMYV